MTSMLALNCQKKSGHTKFYGVGVYLCAQLHSANSRTRLCDVGARRIRLGGLGSIPPLPFKSGITMDNAVNLCESLFFKLYNVNNSVCLIGLLRRTK